MTNKESAAKYRTARVEVVGREIELYAKDARDIDHRASPGRPRTRNAFRAGTGAYAATAAILDTLFAGS